MGSNSDSVEVRSVGNSQVLHETALVEAFNLKVRGCTLACWGVCGWVRV